MPDPHRHDDCTICLRRELAEALAKIAELQCIIHEQAEIIVAPPETNDDE